VRNKKTGIRYNGYFKGKSEGKSVKRDEPVKEETFLKRYSEQVNLYKDIINTLFSENSCLRVAIKGDWGTGKTTLLRALASLYEKEKALVVRFEAWKYAFEEDPFVPLLEEISSIGDSTFRKKIRNIAKVLGVTTAVITETFLKQSFIPTEFSSIEKWFERFEDFLYKKKSERNKKLELLKKTIEELKERKGCNKFILAVDDLDRLVPERAFKLLETLYLYFDIPGSIIIMAVNDTVLNAYVKKHYGIEDSLGNFHFQEEFLDKLFHYSIELQLSHLNDLHLEGFFKEESYRDKICTDLQEFSKDIGKLTHRQWIRTLNLYESEFSSSRDLENGMLSRAGKESFLACALRTVFPEVRLAFRRHGDLALQGENMGKLKEELERKYGNKESGQQAIKILNSIEKLRRKDV